MQDDTSFDDASPQAQSLWLATTPTTDYQPLENGLSVDVAVIGGGIAGLTTALELTERGRSVAVLEADRILEGVTGHTTAKLTAQHGLIYDQLREAFDLETARQYAEANEATIDAVESRVEEWGVDCQFERTPSFVYTESPEDVETIRGEVATAKRIGLSATFVEEPPLPFAVEGAVRFGEQAQFHPRKYLLSVADAIVESGDHRNYVFEETRATGLESGSPCRVETDRGEVVADHVVVATHFPFADRGGYFARMHPHRAYLLAVALENSPPEGMYYSTATPAATFRPASGNGEDLLIVGGQSHKPGLEGVSASERYRRCSRYAREHFDVADIEYRWSTMDYSPVDSVPYIGKLGPGTENTYVATGFSGWGMSGGTVAGTILTDLICDGESPYADLFDPLRFTPKASAKRFLEENTKVGASFVADRITSFLSREDIPTTPDEATLARRRGRAMGVYRDADDTVHAVSAVCPHMACLVRWNDAERTWDCPCHGSRFDYTGDVISGPALEGLPYREISAPQREREPHGDPDSN